MSIQTGKAKYAAVLSVLMLAGCSSTGEKTNISVGGLAGGERYKVETNEEPGTVSGVESTQRFTYLKSLEQVESDVSETKLMSDNFASDNTVEVVTERLSLIDFIHAVFGTSLDVNYVVSDELAQRTDTVTLNLSEDVSSRKLFLVAVELLKAENVNVAERDGVFYLFPASQTDNDVTIGIGNTRADVPRGYNQILQIIPLRYGINASLERSIVSLSKVKLTADYNRGVIFAQGSRDQIIRLIDLIDLLDKPAHQGKNIGVIDLTFVDVNQFVEQARSLLNAEGIDSSVSQRGREPLIFVPLPQIGSVAVFSGSRELLGRVQFWAEKIDKPAEGDEKRFYLYNPVYARASDLGDSIQPLIGQARSRSGGDKTRSTQSAFDDNESGSTNTSSDTNASVSSSGKLAGESIELTVDDRSNKLIFYATGSQYQTLLPIIKQLDIMPKQILLEATIAEITLTEEFAQGFEFAIENGNFNIGNLGSFGVEDIAGLAAGYTRNFDEFIARLSATNSKVNVLSNPRLVVRDGVSASISVGTDIPTVGSTTTDPINSNRQTTNVDYRKTGIQLTVSPTVNAQGLVVMQINQKISNTTDSGSTVAGSPAIFERSIETEVLANSGQTILLGGLVSEDVNNSESKVPGLGDIPVVGQLFRANRQSTVKTELVIFITPRVVTDLSSWDGIMDQLNQGLNTLEINERY